MDEPSIIIAETDRIKLRAMQTKDADEVYEYRNQPDVMLFQGWTPESPTEVSDYAKGMMTRKEAEPGHWYQVVLEFHEQVVGDVAFCIETEFKQQAELGIAINTNFQKLGLAQEAIKGLVSYLFTKHQLHRIHVSIDPENLASRTLFERCGFRFEGHLKKAVWFNEQWCDDIIMAILNEEWLESKTG